MVEPRMLQVRCVLDGREKVFVLPVEEIRAKGDSFLNSLLNHRERVSEGEEDETVLQRDPDLFGCAAEFYSSGQILVPSIDHLDAVERECDFLGIPLSFAHATGSNLGATLHLRHVLCVKQVVRQQLVPRFLALAAEGRPLRVALSDSLCGERELMDRLGSPKAVAVELRNPPFCFVTDCLQRRQTIQNLSSRELRSLCEEAHVSVAGGALQLEARLNKHYSELPLDQVPRDFVHSEVLIEIDPSTSAPPGTEARRIQDELAAMKDAAVERHLAKAYPALQRELASLLQDERALTQQETVITLPDPLPAGVAVREAVLARLTDLLSSQGVSAHEDAGESADKIRLRVSFLPPLFPAGGGKRARFHSCSPEREAHRRTRERSGSSKRWRAESAE
eukprot:Hpha_TRINITY_DN16501_c2_g12::TRINITY_DN16501_c2_g12_i1::g.137221::m.137221